MLLLHVVLTILLLNRTTGEEVDVVEAISGSSSESDSSSDHHHKEQPVNGAIQQRDEPDRGTGNAGNNPDQVALESGSDQESAASHGYSQSLRGSASHVHHQKPFPPAHHPANVPPPGSYHGPPPPLPPPPLHQKPTVTAALDAAMDKLYTAGGNGDQWPLAVSDAPKIISLDVKCEKNSMKVYIAFDKPFYGIVFSKGHYSNLHCVHLPAGLGRTSHTFEVSVHACGTSGNTENGLYGYGSDSGSGSYFENTIVIQYDPQVQEVWDQARKLRCTWHDQYEKSVTFRPFPVDMLDVIRADFAGDNVGCWMQIQVGKGPWASEVSGLVKIGQTMTMVLAIKDDDSKFDMLVRNCMAHDGKRAPIQLVDQRGCVTRTKLMSRFTKIKNFGASASVLSYAHFQAFKFPDSMEVHFQCTIQICRYQCPDQCSTDPLALLQPHHESILSAHHGAVRPDAVYGGPPPPPLPLEVYLRGGGGGGGGGVGTVAHGRRDERRAKKPKREAAATNNDPEKEVGVNRIIKVVSSGDLTFALDDSGSGNGNGSSEFPPVVGSDNYYSSRNKWITDQDVRSSMICMTSFSFSATLVFLLAVLFVSCLLSSILCIRLRSSSMKTTASPTSHQTSTNANRRTFPKNCCFYS